MKTEFIKECDTCWGSGSVLISSAYEHPSHSESDICNECRGEGKYLDYELLTERVEDVEWMIEGMITRIRTTSDNIKMCAKFEMLPDFVARYKNTLHTQARGLARLELYLSNLKTY